MMLRRTFLRTALPRSGVIESSMLLTSAKILLLAILPATRSQEAVTEGWPSHRRYLSDKTHD